jgi:hypothetical protein
MLNAFIDIDLSVYMFDTDAAEIYAVCLVHDSKPLGLS